MKSYRFSRETQEIKELENAEEIPVYATVDDAEADLDNLEEGQIIATKDEVDIVTDTINQIRDEAESIIDNIGSVPVGTIIQLPNNLTSPVGYLKTDGTEFDREKYPALYVALEQSTTLPLKLIEREPEMDKEILTGEFFEGKPVYAYRWKHVSTISATTWYTLTVNGDSVFPYTHNIDKIIKYNVQNSHSNLAYSDGTIDSGMFQIDKSVAQPTLRYYESWQGHYIDANHPLIFTLYYTKNDGSIPLDAEYQYIRALSGAETDAEAEAVTNAVHLLTEKLAYNTLPVGNIISCIDDNHVPFGYIKADGSTFDKEQYPILFDYLGTDVLPDLRDDDETVVFEANPPVYSTNFTVSESLLNFDKVLIFTNRNASPKAEQWGAQVFDRQTIKWMAETDSESYPAGYWGGPNYSTEYTRYRLSGDGITFTYYNGGSSGSRITRIVGVGKRHKFIKAVTGIQDGDDASIVQAIDDAKSAAITAMTSATADLMNIPVGTIMDYTATELPTGYLWCDGSEFDATEYPALRARLHDTHTPKKVHASDVLFESGGYNGLYNQNFSLRHPLWDADLNPLYDRIVIDCTYSAQNSGGGSAGEARGSWSCDVRDLISAYQNAATYQILIYNYTSNYMEFSFDATGQTWTYRANNNGSNMGIVRITGYKVGGAIIKASSGLEDGQAEAQTIVDEMKALSDKVAYSTLPIGTIIERAREGEPTGWLKADGRKLQYVRYKYKNNYYDGDGNPISNLSGSEVTESRAPEVDGPMVNVNGHWYYRYGDDPNLYEYYECDFVDWQTADPDETWQYIEDSGDPETDEALIDEIEAEISLGESVTCEFVYRYPALRAYLDSDTLPDMHGSDETILWAAAGTASTNTTINLSEPIFNFAKIRIYTANSGSQYRSFIAEVDAASYSTWVNSGTGVGSLFISLYSDNHRYYTVDSTGMTITGGGGSGSWNGIYKVVGVGRYNKYIKATTGIDDSPEESEVITNAVAALEQNAEDLKNEIKAASTNSYSLEEQWTGGYWIDGKKIYRRVFQIASWTPTNAAWKEVTGVSIPNIDRVIECGFSQAGKQGFFRGAMVNATAAGTGIQAWFTTAIYAYTEVVVDYTKNEE